MGFAKRAALVAAVLTVLLGILIAYVTAPAIPMNTTGTSLGKAKAGPHLWSRFEIFQLQLKFASAFGLGPADLARCMVIGFPPTGELKEHHLTMVSTQTTRLARYKVNAHDPATLIAGTVDSARPRVVIALASAIPQLTRLLERGRMQHRPNVIVLFGEYLSVPEWERTVRAWAPARVEQFYGATECPFIAKRSRGDGLYRLRPDVELEATDGGVWIRGFPDHKWHTLGDSVSIVDSSDGDPITFTLHDNRHALENSWKDVGLELQDCGIVNAFQVQHVGERRAVIAYVGDEPSDEEVVETFRESFPDWTVTAKHGLDAFRLPTSTVMKKCCGYLALTPDPLS